MSGRTHLLIALCLIPACAENADAPPDAAVAEPAAEAQPTDRIGIAMSAAPAAISDNATIMDFDAAGNLVELRAGTNGWLCLPDDNPAAPGDAPICVDGAWQQWFDAYMNKTTPQITSVGMSYMLRGGPAASNTDPFATAPAGGEDWIEDGPHVMVIVPDPAMLDAFPTQHGSGVPYVMWKGTPYAHLMVPVTTH